jgi:non-ribosomal peptide synthetase component F
MSMPEASNQNDPTISSRKKMSFIQGDQKSSLFSARLGDLIDEQGAKNGSRTAAVFSWQSHSITYAQLAERSRLLAKSMLDAGLKHGDTVGIMAGNCYQYIEAFLGAARIGCPFVVFNNTYSAKELVAALATSCMYHFVWLLHEACAYTSFSLQTPVCGDGHRTEKPLPTYRYRAEQSKIPARVKSDRTLVANAR